MSAHEWNPGDLGLTVKGTLALRRAKHPDGWIDQHGAPWSTATYPENVRPLVVIDPEDREQVERLAEIFVRLDHARYGIHIANAVGVNVADDIQAALRSLIDPPKPAEPTGLGAVVEDVTGTRWTRVELGNTCTRNPWYPAADGDQQPEEWAHIAVVRVHWEGVQ